MINYGDDAIRVSLNIKIRYLRSMGIIMNVLLQISILLYVLENNVENTEGESRGFFLRWWRWWTLDLILIVFSDLIFCLLLRLAVKEPEVCLPGTGCSVFRNPDNIYLLGILWCWYYCYSAPQSGAVLIEMIRLISTSLPAARDMIYARSLGPRMAEVSRPRILGPGALLCGGWVLSCRCDVWADLLQSLRRRLLLIFIVLEQTPFVKFRGKFPILSLST